MASDLQFKLKEQSDHLVPVDSHIEPAYMQLLSHRLFLSAANYGRILVMPSTNEGEFAIAIYSRSTQNGSDDTAVTCTKAEKNLWYSLFQSQQTKTNLPTVPVTRTDAPIPKSTALAVSKAIEQMILHSRSPDHSVELLDGTDIRFSIEREGAEPLEGLLAPYAHGRQTQSLHQLTKLLTNYCQAKGADRRSLVIEIEREANGLVQALNGK